MGWDLIRRGEPLTYRVMAKTDPQANEERPASGRMKAKIPPGEGDFGGGDPQPGKDNGIKDDGILALTRQVHRLIEAYGNGAFAPELAAAPATAADRMSLGIGRAKVPAPNEQEAANEIYQRLDRELAVEEARADRLLRLYNL